MSPKQYHSAVRDNTKPVPRAQHVHSKWPVHENAGDHSVTLRTQWITSGQTDEGTTALVSFHSTFLTNHRQVSACPDADVLF